MPNSSQPPKLSLKLIRWFCKDELVEELQGDLEQYYAESSGSSFNGLKYWYQVFNYLRPSTLKSFKNSKSRTMFIFNPILTFRNLYRHLSTSLISLFGFTMGLVATIFLYFYIYSEITTDDFHADGDQIYRTIRVSEMNGTPYRIGVTSAPYAKALINDYPSDILSTTRVVSDDGLVEIANKKFLEDNIVFVDDNFFEFFTYPLKDGDKETVLATGNSAVLSSETAKKYFGDANPIGEIIRVDNEYEFIVSGVLSELPGNTHLDFNIILPISIFEGFDWFSGWWNNSLNTYVKIANPQVASNLEGQLDQFMEKYMGDDFARSGSRVGLELERLDDIYFNNETRYDTSKHGSFSSILTLGAVAIAILFIACFNYVNLSIAQSFMRAKEVGVRKVLGGSKWRLVFQFLSESLMILFLSIAISITLCELLDQAFNSFFGLDVVLNWVDTNVLIFFTSLVIIILLSSGVYPAFLLSSFKSVTILKGSKLTSGKNVGLRKALVITQFAISIFLIVASMLISVQTNYLNSKDLGFHKEAIVLVELNNSEIRSQREEFKNRLLANANIKGVTKISGAPGGFHDASSFEVTGLPETYRMRTLFTDTDYFDVMGIDMIAGRAFSKDISTDEEFTVILNKRSVVELGLEPEEVLGRKISMPGWDIENVPVIGVAADYHFSTLKDEIEPLAILSGGFHRRLAVKINMVNMKDGLLFMGQTFTELFPEYPMAYQFLDDSLKKLYEKEHQQARVFSAFSAVSIFLACLGIFGLATYAAQQRQKELGIRKILGATVQQIIGLISKEFVWLVLIASGISIPIVWYFIKEWLSGYAYRIEVIDHWYVFLIGGVLTVFIALLTVSIKTYKAAISDPTESIRNE
ncbi:ABC transporter permease [Ekhidna sp.]